MRKLATYEGVVENGHVTLPPDVDIPERTHVYVLVPDIEMGGMSRIATPRLANPEQANDFKMEVIEDGTDADV
jgi:hypothetical protein